MRTPDGIEVWPIRNDGAEGHWRWGREHSMRPILEDPERAHWELRAFDEGVTWNGQRERWVPYEKIRDASTLGRLEHLARQPRLQRRRDPRAEGHPRSQGLRYAQARRPAALARLAARR